MSKSRKSPKRNTRQLRDRKVRKFYTDDILGDADDDIEGPQSFDLEEKLASTKYTNKPLVKELKGTEFDLSYIQQHGFTSPLLFKDKTGLGIRIPGPNFSVSDVKTCVGSKRLLDVMDVRTQKNLEMTMKQWQEYYDNPAKDRLLNVISLEFSHTKLENYVESPTVVRQLDWVDRVWPQHLKKMQTESTNVMDEMMYPKVQKYCLMSVKGCYTDFHVDFGGTSVWYHILKGAKVFWLIPPTEKNLDLYQAWVLSGKQGDTFFGDNVEDCGRVYLQSGDTFFIPSGWIHAVYTPKDSLVFGGNFLHSFGIDKQLRIAMVEEATKVPQKFRYPFFTEMLWYTLERYAHCLLGHNYIRIPKGEMGSSLDKDLSPQITEKLVPDGVHISPQELLGLKSIVVYLHQLTIQRKNVPVIIYDPVALLRSIRQIVVDHRFDNPDKAVTGRPILVWPGERAEDVGKIQPVSEKKKGLKISNMSTLTMPEENVNHQNTKESEILQRRVRCGVCQSCMNTEDCNECVKCLSTRNSVCIMRECMAPLLPVLSVCCECGLDGWGDIPGPSAFTTKKSGPSTLLECSVCLEITHALCIGNKASEKVLGIVNDDLPNSWECPVCIEKNSNTPRRIARLKSCESRESTGNVHQPITKPADEGRPVFKKQPFANLSQLTKPDVAGPSSSPVTSTPVPVVVLKKEIKMKTGKDPAPVVNRNSSNDKAKLGRDDEVQVQQKLTLVQQRLLQGRKSIDDPISIKKGHTKKPNGAATPPAKESPAERKPAGKRPVLAAKSTGRSAPSPPPKSPTTKQVSKVKRSLSPPPNKRKKPALKRRASEQPAPKAEIDFDDDLPPVLIPMVDLHLPPLKKIKIDPKIEPKVEPEEVEDVEEDNVAEEVVEQKTSPIKFPQRTQLSSNIMTRSAKALKNASNVVRPAQFSEEPSPRPVEVKTEKKDATKRINYWKDKEVMIQVFQRFNVALLNKAMCVCKDWNQIGVTPFLWRNMDLTHQEITMELMQGVVRRQPRTLILDWTAITRAQLNWMLVRMPQLKELSLKGVTCESLLVLKCCACPVLASLDLSYMSGLTDCSLKDILGPPSDSRPGLTGGGKSRLRQLKTLNLAGASISDVALRYITQYGQNITKLDLSTCSRITDAGIAQLGAPDSPFLQNLVSLNVSGCPQLTNISLDHLRLCSSLKALDIRNIPQITLSGLTKFHRPVFPRSRAQISVKSDFNSKSIYAMPSTSGTGAAGPSNLMGPFMDTTGFKGTGLNSAKAYVKPKNIH